MAFLTDEKKDLLLERYFDIEWCDDVSELRCVHCNRVAISHSVFRCHHLICKTCKEFNSDGDRQLNCPQCQECITETDDEDFDVEVKIHQLRMFCPNRKYGCNYAGQLRKMPSHFVMCVATQEVSLPVKSPVVNQLTNQLMSTIGEVRQWMMELSDKIEEKFNKLERKTDNIDSKINILTSEVKKIEERKADMQLTYTNYTEEFQLMKLKLDSLNQRLKPDESFVQETMEKISLNVEEMKTKMITTSAKNESIQTEIVEKVNPLKALTYECAVKDVNKHEDHMYESEVFNIAGYKHEFKAKMENKYKVLVVSLQLKDGDKINQFLNRDGFITVTYIVRDQSNSQKKKDILCKDHLKFGNDCVHCDWILKYLLPEHIMSAPYNVDNCIKIAMLFEPPSSDCSIVSNNGVLTWTVDNYKMRKEEHLLCDNWSPSFYTSPQGYRVRIQLLLYERSTFAEVHFLTGEHDAMLTKKFRHTTTVTLINQTDSSKNLVTSEKRKDVELYTVILNSRESIEQTGFIKNDSLMLKVMIEPVARK